MSKKRSLTTIQRQQLVEMSNKQGVEAASAHFGVSKAIVYAARAKAPKKRVFQDEAPYTNSEDLRVARLKAMSNMLNFLLKDE